MSGSYVLSHFAQEDLVSIHDYYLEHSGKRVARRMLSEFIDAFRLLVRSPHIGHRRHDILEDRPVLVWGIRDYLVIYRADSSPLQILMIVRGSRDVPLLLLRRKI